MGIVVIGATFIDLKGYPFHTFISDGRNAGVVEQVHGGVCRNIAHDIANSHLKPTFLSVLDHTGLSTEILDALNQANCETKYIQRTDSGLGKWLAIFNEKGDVYGSISQRPDLSALIDVLKKDGDVIFSNCDSIVIEIDQEEEILKPVFDYAAKYNKDVYAVVSNMSIASKRKDWIRKTACLVCNLEEAQIFFDENFQNLDPLKLAHKISGISQSADYPPIVVTMGDQGAIYADRNGTYGHVLAQDLEVVDTTGCGDAFFAGVTIGMTYGLNLEQACHIGTSLASRVIMTKENVCPSVDLSKWDLVVR